MTAVPCLCVCANQVGPQRLQLHACIKGRRLLSVARPLALPVLQHVGAQVCGVWVVQETRCWGNPQPATACATVVSDHFGFRVNTLT